MIKLITLNIEGDLHTELVSSFLQEEKADVVCLQEAYEDDVRVFAAENNQHYLFMPMMIRSLKSDSPVAPLGIALLSSHPFLEKEISYYRPPRGGQTQTYDGMSVETIHDTVARGIILVKIEKDGAPCTIATTHFTWTPDSKPDSFQREDIQKLLAITSKNKDLILCGDFNMPRESTNDIYNTLIEQYIDNIPSDFQTTLDVAMHTGHDDAAVRERLSHDVVDYIFSTSGYAVRHVRQQFNISDHSAIIADLYPLG